MLSDSQRVSLPPEAGKQVEDQRQHYAEYDAAGQREIERGMFAAISNISRQAAKGNSCLAEKQDQNAE